MKIYKHQDIYGMSRVGKIKTDGDTYEIFVNTDDAGNIPHFHFRCIDDWSKFHSCIEIARAEYFSHGSKQDKLNSKQRKELQKFMCEPTNSRFYHEDGSRINNWEYICELWNLNNSDVQLDDNIEQPDYTKLP